jgi:hypothetical protein
MQELQDPLSRWASAQSSFSARPSVVRCKARGFSGNWPPFRSPSQLPRKSHGFSGTIRPRYSRRMATGDQEHIFVAPIQKIWIMRCVDVPADASAAIRAAATGDLQHPPVHGFVEGRAFKSTLSPGKKGCYRLHIHSRIWRKLQIDVGAEVEVTVMLDEAPRPAIVPPDLARALASKPIALKTFNALTLPLRRQILWYLGNAKHASTREKRVKLMVQRMLERAAKKDERKIKPGLAKRSAKPPVRRLRAGKAKR